jgi:hypothetical protein
MRTTHREAGMKAFREAVGKVCPHLGFVPRKLAQSLGTGATNHCQSAISRLVSRRLAICSRPELIQSHRPRSGSVQRILSAMLRPVIYPVTPALSAEALRIES